MIANPEFGTDVGIDGRLRDVRGADVQTAVRVEGPFAGAIERQGVPTNAADVEGHQRLTVILALFFLIRASVAVMAESSPNLPPPGSGIPLNGSGLSIVMP